MPPDPTPDPAAPFPYDRVPPDLLAYARQTFDLAAFEAEVAETLATGGHTFESFIDELEARAGGP